MLATLDQNIIEENKQNWKWLLPSAPYTYMQCLCNCTLRKVSMSVTLSFGLINQFSIDLRWMDKWTLQNGLANVTDIKKYEYLERLSLLLFDGFVHKCQGGIDKYFSETTEA